MTLQLDKSKAQSVESFSGEMRVKRAKAIVERVEKWAVGEGWMLEFNEEDEEEEGEVEEKEEEREGEGEGERERERKRKREREREREREQSPKGLSVYGNEY